jgi:hypothetical protein
MDTDEIISKAQTLIDTAKMSVEEAQEHFNALGYEPVFETVEKDVPVDDGTITKTVDVKMEQYPGTEAYYVKEATTVTEPYNTGKKTRKVIVPAFTADGTPKIKSLTKKSSGAMNNFSSANAGGKTSSGSKPKKAKRPKKSDVVERYKEINDKLKETGDLMETNNKLANSLWGDERFGKLEEEIDLLERENE